MSILKQIADVWRAPFLLKLVFLSLEGHRFGRAAFAAIAQDRAAQRMLHMSAATMK